ncbi:MAG: PaaI family thioesterase [Betaproteobacteria bacterium]
MNSIPKTREAMTEHRFPLSPFLELLGAKSEKAAKGKARLSLELQPQLRNRYDGFHGGVIMTLLDVVMATAAVSRSDFQNTVVTVDISVSFLAPASGQLFAEGEASGGGRSICFCEGRVIDAHGTLIAKAQGTFKYLKLSPNSFGEETNSPLPSGIAESKP